MREQAIRSTFPALDPVDFRLTSPQTPAYNCIAYAAGDHRRWWWPDPDGICYWPPGVQRTVRFQAFQHAFETLGYRLSSDESLVTGREKIAIFANGREPTHAAKQLASGLWSSKLGRLEDISHNLLGVENQEYGELAFIMERTIRVTL